MYSCGLNYHLSWLNEKRTTFKGSLEFPTTEKNIMVAFTSIKSKKKYLTIEQGPLTYWAAQIAAPYVDQVIVCDPRANALISNKISNFWTGTNYLS